MQLAFWLIVVGVAACSGQGKDCAGLADPRARGDCHFERLEIHIGRQDLPGTIAEIKGIAAPVVRFAAIQRLVASSIEGLDHRKVGALCAELPAEESERCSQMWGRRHLYERLPE